MPIRLSDYLMPYQRRFVADRSRYRIWTAARQIGKSTALAYDAVDGSWRTPETAALVVSRSERQSKEVNKRVQVWCEALKAAFPGARIVRKMNTEEIIFSNGSRVLSLPANPNTIRGFTGHVYLDEFAFHQDSSAMWEAVLPITTRGFRVTISSTPNGQNNLFYDFWSDSSGFWSRHKTTIHQAVDEGLKVEPESLRAACVDEETWRQEYLCEFVDQATAYLPYELIRTVESEDAGVPTLTESGPTYLGVDIGRRHDLTVIWVVEQLGDVLWTREVEELHNQRFDVQERTLDRIFNHYKPSRVCMDQTGLGEKMVEDAQTRLGRARIEGVTFTAPVKQDLAAAVKKHFEDRSIRIPVSREIRDDLHSLQRTVTSAGNVRFDAARTPDGHADRFWALALACHAADNPAVMPQVLTAPVRTTAAQLRGF